MGNVAIEEKRSTRRFALQLPVTITALSGEQFLATAETRDVSSHGICFYCDTALQRDSAIEFTLTLPAEVTMTESIQVHCRGKVVRVEAPGHGIPFVIAAQIQSYEFIPSKAKENSVPPPSAPPAV